MWVLNNETPFAAERAFVRDRDGREVWVVAVKATYDIHKDGTTQLAKEQELPCQVPVHWGEPSQSSLRYETDLILCKPGTDVLVQGQAYAPGGKATSELEVALGIGNGAKRLRVFGNRIWKKGPLGLEMTPPEPFVVMPIVYERAYGGQDPHPKDPDQPLSDARNPVGLGFAERSSSRVGQAVPNIEFPNALLASHLKRAAPAGLGPIASHWMPRAHKAGTYDAAWQEQRMPLLPLDFSEDFFRCAPVDQQMPGFLQGGETIAVQNMTPSGFLRCSLPRVRLRYVTDLGGDPIEHFGDLHSVMIEPEYPRIMMVWHTSLTCHNIEHRLESTRIEMEH